MSFPLGSYELKRFVVVKSTVKAVGLGLPGSTVPLVYVPKSVAKFNTAHTVEVPAWLVDKWGWLKKLPDGVVYDADMEMFFPATSLNVKQKKLLSYKQAKELMEKI